MLSAQPPRVLILARTGEFASRCVNALEGFAEIVDWDEEEARNLDFDVMITDMLADPAGQTTGLLVQAEDVPTWRWPKPTVLGIGVATEPWADMALPEDATARELRIACTLLTEVARLRKQRTDIAQLHDQVKELAETDPLTGLANRRAWDRQLELMCASAAQACSPLWLAIIDLDRFKLINDQHGFSAGDQILQMAAKALAGNLRREDLLARLGGDEFGLLMSGSSESMCDVLERLRAAIAAQSFPSDNKLTASIGFASATKHPAPRDWFAAAERALRQAKQSGGNKVCGGKG